MPVGFTHAGASEAAEALAVFRFTTFDGGGDIVYADNEHDTPAGTTLAACSIGSNATLGVLGDIVDITASGTIDLGDEVTAGADGVAVSAELLGRGWRRGVAMTAATNGLPVSVFLKSYFRSEGNGAETQITTAGAATYSKAAIAGGYIERDPNGAARTDLIGTAAQFIADHGLAADGQRVSFLVKNMADADEAITIQGGAGVTVASAAVAVAQNGHGRVTVIRTSSTTCDLLIEAIA